MTKIRVLGSGKRADNTSVWPIQKFSRDLTPRRSRDTLNIRQPFRAKYEIVPVVWRHGAAASAAIIHPTASSATGAPRYFPLPAIFPPEGAHTC